jgi:hypothetical protein
LALIIQYSSFNLEAEALEIAKLQSLRQISGMCSKRALRGSVTLTVVLSPDPLFPIPSTSSDTETPDPQSTGPSVPMVKTERTGESVKGDRNAPQPAGEGDIQMDYSSDLLCRSNVGAVTKNYL